MTSKRPKLSNFSVASLLASAQRPRSPDRAPEEVETRSRAEEEEEDMVKEEEDEQEMTDEESDVSVDSHGEEEAGMLYSNSRLNDSSDLDGDSSTHRSTSSPLSSSDASNRPVSPPRSSEGLPGHPRLAMPTPLLGGRAGFPGLPPGVHLPPGIFPPGWHGLLPPPGLPNLFKSGELDCICICISNQFVRSLGLQIVRFLSCLVSSLPLLPVIGSHLSCFALVYRTQLNAEQCNQYNASIQHNTEKNTNIQHSQLTVPLASIKNTERCNPFLIPHNTNNARRVCCTTQLIIGLLTFQYRGSNR